MATIKVMMTDEVATLDRKVTVIGRSSKAHVTISDVADLSREHCTIRKYEDGRFTITDCATRNGTFVNGDRIYEETLLNDRDKVRLGKFVECLFLDPEAVERQKAERAAAKAKAEQPTRHQIIVDGDTAVSDAMTDVNRELSNKGFKTIMAEIVKDTKKTPKRDDDAPNQYW